MTRVKSQINRLSQRARKWKRARVAAFAVFLFLVATPYSAQASGFNLAVSPTSATTQPGSAAVFIITVKCNTCNVLVGASISPVVSNGPTLTLSSYHLINGGTPALRVDAGPSTPLMTYTITVIVKDTQSSQTKSASVTLTVNDFTVTANPTSVTVPAGQTATSTVTATGLNGFSGTIYYSVNMPSATTTGLACNLQPDPVTLSSTVTSVSSTLSCSGTPGTYNVIISGSPYNGSPVRSATVTITVN
jgi:hypothetical protein